jgi:hypothetical protein
MRAIAMALVVLLAGCETELARLTVVSSKNCEISRVDLGRMTVHHGLVGHDTRGYALGIPLWRISLERAVDELLAAGGGDLAIDARVTYVRYEFLLFGWDTVRVYGDVVNSLEQPTFAAPPSPGVRGSSSGPRGVAPATGSGGVRGAR